MKKIILLTILIITILSCATSKENSNNGNGFGIKQKTSNPNTPYIYKNGYDNFEIIPVLTVNKKDSTYINELRFNAVFSAMYTKKLMYDKFGKWDKEVWINNDRHPILLWEKRKIFGENGASYTIVTSGTENRKEMYASVIVFDNENHDCLTEKSPKKEFLINYFSNGIKSLSTSKEFYDVYWKVVK
jgi:hypothetical protein